MWYAQLFADFEGKVGPGARSWDDPSSIWGWLVYGCCPPILFVGVILFTILDVRRRRR